MGAFLRALRAGLAVCVSRREGWWRVQQVLVFAVTAAANPTLLAAATVLLILPNPKKLMLGYLLGALMTSVTLGLVIVFALQDSAAVSTAKRTVNPALDIALGSILLVVSIVIASDRRQRHSEQRRERKGPKRRRGLRVGSEPSRRALRGSPSSWAPCSRCLASPTSPP